ncbi:hypothetical protein KKG58_04260 [Patescibacteria group bacterium]|nr:hypothetical protein [Patescibacteria group bacterium]
MKAIFKNLKKEYESHTKNRYLIINDSNQALHQAKQAIFALHRDEFSQAQKLLFQIEKTLIGLQPNLKKVPDFKYTGAYKAALEEYLEAKLFYQVLKFEKMKPISKIKINFADYLAASCDLTGELVRKIVLLATEGDVKRARDLKELIAEIVGELTKINLTGYLRHKYDDAKRNLKKAEEILYDLKIRKG